MITPNRFPEGDAGAIRDESFAAIYKSLGYQVIHIGMNNNILNGDFNGIKYYSLYKKRNNLSDRIKSILTYKKRLSDLVAFIITENGQPSLFHLYDIGKEAFEYIVKLGEKLSIPMVHDSVEWYSPCEFTLGRFSYQYYFKNRMNQKVVNNPVGVYAISTYLENHYISRGLKTIRIPVIMQSHDYCIDQAKINNNINKKIRIVYAGSPARKDFLRECLEGFQMLSEKEKELFEFNIIGVDNEHINTLINAKNNNQITAFGRIPRKDVLQRLLDSDFSILIRPESERYAQAGFPTKVVEAMMNNCAMICNYSSDLEMYLKDSCNAIIVQDHTKEAVYEAFRRVLQLSREEIESLKENARITAEKYFDYKVYIDDVRRFIEEIDYK